MTLEQILATLQELMQEPLRPMHVKAIQAAIERLSKPAKAKAEPEPAYQQFVELYFQWHEATVGIQPPMGAREGKVMKEIIAYLRNNSKRKDDDGALDAWQFILRHWNLLSEFLQKQVSLSNIQRNLPEIIMQLKQHGASQGRKNTSAQLAARIAQRRNDGTY